MPVAYGQATDETSTGDGAVDDGDDIGKFGFEHRVEVGTASDSNETVCVGETCKHADFGRVFELATDSHDGNSSSGVSGGGSLGSGGGQREKELLRGRNNDRKCR